MRMSSGASCIYEKPRCPSSSWGEETPRSNSIPSTASMPCSSNMAATSRKFPCTMVTLSAQGARRAEARSMEARSRSMAISLPPSPRRLAISEECPPRPSVPST